MIADTAMWNQFVSEMEKLGVSSGYHIFPRSVVPERIQLQYWDKLASTDALEKRFCGFDNITPDAAFEWMQGSDNTYFIVDLSKYDIVAEFTLENFMGKAAQMHFSGAPKNSPQFNAWLSTAVSDQIVNYWKDQADISKPFVEALFGLTPVKNRVALLFALKCGFKKLGVIPGVIPDGDDYSPATLTVKTRGI